MILSRVRVVNMPYPIHHPNYLKAEDIYEQFIKSARDLTSQDIADKFNICGEIKRIIENNE